MLVLFDSMNEKSQANKGESIFRREEDRQSNGKHKRGTRQLKNTEKQKNCSIS
jgi:hypothetical protein